MYHSISFLSFQRRFSTEEKCRDYLFHCRWPNGFVCPKCNGTDYSVIATRGLYQCSQCRHQASVRVGTIFEKSRTPLRKWFWAIYLLSQHKNSIAALTLSRFLNIAYWTALSMTHKIRSAMADRDARYQLSHLVEVDDAYFGGQRAPGKRGRGAGKKTTVIVAVQLSAKEKPQYASMMAVENMSEAQVTKTIKEQVTDKSTIRSDAYSSYKVLEKHGYTHKPVIVSRSSNKSDLLKWVNIMISNAKAVYRGTHHGVSDKHLQKYLSEFCYRFNRRFDPSQLFDRLLTACVNSNHRAIAELFA